jgi:predicted membrane protein
VERELLKFGGGVSHTIINPFVAIAILIAGILLCTLPRHKAIAPFLAASILIPFDQVLLIGPFHFMMLRIVVLFGITSLAAG